jgi:hypothetical protein
MLHRNQDASQCEYQPDFLAASCSSERSLLTATWLHLPVQPSAGLKPISQRRRRGRFAGATGNNVIGGRQDFSLLTSYRPHTFRIPKKRPFSVNFNVGQDFHGRSFRSASRVGQLSVHPRARAAVRSSEGPVEL